MQPENKNDLFDNLSFDFTAKQYIRTMASWATVIVVVALISYVITLISIFTTPKIQEVRSEGFDLGMKMTNSGNYTFTILSIIVGLVLNLFLLRFARQARAGLDGLNQSRLNSSFNSLKNYFMIGSILCLLAFVFILGATILSSLLKW